ncbi:hypothetical protein DFJ73DRAFT_776194 [Zopfochytrium polystomum]|nr:hypothetical protein DFJ73DRAFT_776194 [Zopfochytrium polystomum]
MALWTQGTAAGPQQREVSHHADQLRKDVLTLLDRACAEIFDRDKTIENLRVEKAHLFRQLTMANAEVSRLHDENLRVRRELDLAARPAPTTHVANAQPPTGEEAGPPKAIDNPRPESRAAQQVPSSSVVWTEVIRSRWPNMATLDRMFIRQVRQRLAPFWEKHGLPAPGEKRYCVEPHLFDELIKYGEIFAGDLLGAQSGQSGQRERPQNYERSDGASAGDRRFLQQEQYT